MDFDYRFLMEQVNRKKLRKRILICPGKNRVACDSLFAALAGIYEKWTSPEPQL
jgi:hypothetical protein